MVSSVKPLATTGRDAVVDNPSDADYASVKPLATSVWPNRTRSSTALLSRSTRNRSNYPVLTTEFLLASPVVLNANSRVRVSYAALRMVTRCEDCACLLSLGVVDAVQLFCSFLDAFTLKNPVGELAFTTASVNSPMPLPCPL